MKTAVEQLAIALYEGGYLKGNGDEIQELVDQAKEMEREQIVDAMDEGFNDGIRVGQFKEDAKFSSGEQYYEKTYGGNE
jgi:hypothetical protein